MFGWVDLTIDDHVKEFNDLYVIVCKDDVGRLGSKLLYMEGGFWRELR